ncbi:MAG: translation initiation factor IF-2 [Lewinellaceae bacterium]|nr:translation initiation factor IF-2 [Saprospiraceae bacterium]MCB9332656.1 translation initiation factor IF-2 [Lewinellaceae bacterium]
MALKLIKVAKNFNVGLHTIVETLRDNGFSEVEDKPTAEITDEMLDVLQKEFQGDMAIKQEADKLARPVLKKEPVTTSAPSSSAGPDTPSTIPPARPPAPKEEVQPEPQPKKEATEPELVKRERPALRVVGKVDLDALNKPAKTEKPAPEEEKTPKVSAETPEAPEETKPTPPSKKEEVEEKGTAAPQESKAPEPMAPASAEPDAPAPEVASEDSEFYRADSPQLRGLKILGKVNLEQKKKESADKGKPSRDKGKGRDGKGGQGGNQGGSQGQQERQGNANDSDSRRKRKRKKVQQPITAAAIQASLTSNQGDKKGRGRNTEQKEVSQKEIEDQIRKTMSRMGAGASRKRQKIRRDKRENMRERAEQAELAETDQKLLVTEFISVSDLASLMNVSPSDVIKACMSLGIFVSINQRLDAEIIEVVSSEFGFEVEFISAEEQVEVVEEEIDDPKDLVSRQPIVTVMGHVDHGKTSLLDYIRKANVAEGEAGGITQHIGAYEVVVSDNDETKKITFLDTPGHEAFTAMRARGAKVTDIAIIVIAADDNIMPQTKEAISHAQAAGVPIVFAINKVDKDGADPDRIKNSLAQMNLLVEEWGGKFQSQDISAKTGLNVDKLLEKVLLEAEILDLKANPTRRAIGTVLEASLDKGRGYVAKILVENGTLDEGDPMIAGEFSGKVKAMFNERGKRIKHAGPATPVLVLGLSGAPQAGEKIKETATESEARDIATRRAQIIREQSNRANKRISLEEIGRRLALGNFKELNLIVKGDVDGSIEALSDSLIKLSMEKIQVNVIHKAVGQIVDSDVMLASASDAIIIGFQVRPSITARKLAEKEGVDIRLYSIIYEAIEKVKSAMEGMLEPTKEEEIMGQAEVRDVFKISKVGTVAGCYVQEGKINRNHYVRVIRDGIVIYPVNEGQHAELSSLKRFKEDAKEVRSSLECGMTIRNFNDIKVGDVIESYVINEVKATL